MTKILIKYCEDGEKKYNSFISGGTHYQNSNDGAKWMNIEPIKETRVKVEFTECYKHEKNANMVWVKMIDDKYKYGDYWTTSKAAYMRIKFTLPKDAKPIKYIAFVGKWYHEDEYSSYEIEKNYRLDKPKSSSKTMKNASSVLKSEISDNVKVSGETDTINVTGVEPGQNIKIYTVSGVEVKSVVANDDVVNIKLPTNQMYVVKTGQARYKVAL